MTQLYFAPIGEPLEDEAIITAEEETQEEHPGQLSLDDYQEVLWEREEEEAYRTMRDMWRSDGYLF